LLVPGAASLWVPAGRPLVEETALEEAEDGFDGDPGRNGAARGITRRHEFPAANGLLGAFIKSQADSFDDADLRSASVDANQYFERHGSL
jgi:hypothetical protein